MSGMSALFLGGSTPLKQKSLFQALSALTHWLDLVLWRDIFSCTTSQLDVGLLCVWAAHRVFKRVMGRGWTILLCTLLFAVQDSHTFANAWLANRNANVAFVFGMLAVDQHIKHRREGRWLHWPVLLMVLSLLSAEAGLCALAFIGAWAVFYECKLAQSNGSLMPYLGLLVFWRWAYRAMGWDQRLQFYTEPEAGLSAFLKSCRTLPCC